MSAAKAGGDFGFDLGKYAEQRVRVKFAGGREVDGVLKGFDKLDNLVLDDCIEYLRGMSLTTISFADLIKIRF
jgi:U6 snRNA-associated Sm-like protein LSm7